MLLNPHTLVDNHMYALATVPGDNNLYGGVKFVDGVARLVPGVYAKRLVGFLNPLHVFRVEDADNIQFEGRQPVLRKPAKPEPPKPKKRGRPKKVDKD